ncbi:PrpF domain-containing protein [Paraburkholderia tropica]|uniref:PrpF domain-containing protein n=1 Tax=Paraburkholderia tropica TaxID=92647 RepID=UPI0030183E04
MTQDSVQATYMRGGTSKGLFFDTRHLPAALLSDNNALNRFLLRSMGSPDPYGTQIDGMGGATPSTSKVILVSPSVRDDCDVAYRFAAISTKEATVDWSNNCGNLTAAVAPFALFSGLAVNTTPGLATVRMWQANIGQRIIACVPVHDGLPVETGTFELDGVAFPSAEIRLEFLEGGGEPAWPTGQVCQHLDIPGHGGIDVSLVRSGAPTVFVDARTLGLDGTELASNFEGNASLCALIEQIRAHAAVAMGVAKSAEEASARHPRTLRIALVAPPRDYLGYAGKKITSSSIDLTVRMFSLGKLHRTITGTGAVALAVAAACPDSIPARVMPNGATSVIRFGHPSGTLEVGATVRYFGQAWHAEKVTLSRSARRLMCGELFLPAR